MMLAAILFTMSDVARAQEEDRPRTINYSYAAVVGSGYYKLDDRNIAVLRIPFSKRFRDPTTEQFGIKALLPVTFGVHNYEADADLGIEGGRFETLSFVPGIELQFLPTKDWALKPFAHAGVGWELNDNDSDLIWAGGIRSRALVRRKSPQIALGAELLAASNHPDDDDLDDYFSRLGIGIDFRFPLNWTIGSRATSITTHLNLYDYLNELELGVEGGNPFEIGGYVEFGLALGLDPPLTVLGFTVDRVGLGVRYGDDLRAIVLVRKFPF